MKITLGDYKRLENIIQKSFETLPLEMVLDEAKSRGWSNARICWSYFNYVATPGISTEEDYLFLRSLHTYLNDDHIETAMFKIIITQKKNLEKNTYEKN